MSRRWSRKVAIGVGLLASAGMLLPGPITPAFAAKPVPGGSNAAEDPALNALGEIADTPANRRQIAVNDLAALWHSAGLSGVPSVMDALSAKGKGFAASEEILGGGALGTAQFPYVAQDPAPLGYPVLALSEELVVGTPPNVLTEVWGPIQAGPLASALRKYRAVESQAGTTQLFDFQAAARQVTNIGQLQGIGRLALAGGGGRLVGATSGFPETALIGLAEQKAQPHSLASDPAVSQLLAVFPADATTLTMGTSLVTNPLGKSATPAALHALLTQSGLGKLTPPTFAGLAFSGPSNAARVTAAAVYRSAPDAQAATARVGVYLRTGTSPINNVRYTKLWQVTGNRARGDVAVIQLTTKTPLAVSNAIENADFPLFWSL